MLFLGIGYFNAEKMDEKSEQEMEGIMSQCEPFMKDLYASDRVLLDLGLDTRMKVLKRQSNQITVTDGPFTETKEVIGSTFLIEADDLEDAVRIASLHPTTQVEGVEELGWRLEVRPIHYIYDRKET